MTLPIEYEACQGCAPREFMLHAPDRSQHLEADCIECLRRTMPHPGAKALQPTPIRWSYERLAMYCSRRIASMPEVA